MSEPILFSRRSSLKVLGAMGASVAHRKHSESDGEA
jgi:hypothetical protein